MRERVKQSRLLSEPAQIMGPRLMFIASVVVLCVFGLVMVYSASAISAYNEFGNASFYVTRQAIFLGLGIVVCVVCAAIPYGLWSRPAVFITLWTISVVLLLATAFGLGVSALGAERSIIIAGFALQPAEFAKIFVLLTVASIVKMQMDGVVEGRRFILLIIFSAAIPLVLIYRQPDLGTAIILAVGLIALGLLAGVSWKIIGVILGAVAGYVVFACVTQPYHLDRIVSMLDPWLDKDGDGYQAVQSLYAFGSGGLFGTGLGLSRQKYLYLPYAHTDFIFAIVGEELGLIGAVFLVAVFGVFIFAGIQISRSASDMFGSMLSGSITTMIGFQACVNMACVIGIAPVTGKALPFISYGGSSLVATLMMVGIVLSVSFRSRIDAEHERRRDNFVVYEGGRNSSDSEYASNVISLRRSSRERERRENLERTSDWSGRGRSSSRSRKRDDGDMRAGGSSSRSQQGRSGRSNASGARSAGGARGERSTGGASGRSRNSGAKKSGGYASLKPKNPRR